MSTSRKNGLMWSTHIYIYPGGIRYDDGWDHIREPVIVCFPAFSCGEFSQKVIIYVPSRELCWAHATLSRNIVSVCRKYWCTNIIIFRDIVPLNWGWASEKLGATQVLYPYYLPRIARVPDVYRHAKCSLGGDEPEGTPGTRKKKHTHTDTLFVFVFLIQTGERYTKNQYIYFKDF